MGSKRASPVAHNNVEACEIIELTIGDLETLTRAFHVIKEVCEQRSCDELASALERPASYLEN